MKENNENVIKHDFDKVYRIQEELIDDVFELTEKYSGTMSTAQFIGCLYIAITELSKKD